MIGRLTEKAGASSFARQALGRVPLAEALCSLWAFVMQKEFLDEVFQRHRGRSFEQVLTFPVFVELIADALLQHHGSGRQAFERGQKDAVLETSVEAVYGKLRRVPISLSQGFLVATTARLRELQPHCHNDAVCPKSLGKFTLVIVDGKKLKQVAKRLLVSRGQPGKLFGGKLLVAYVPTEGLVRTFCADRDGEANDCKLMADLIPAARQAIVGPRLWILDRQFCDLKQPLLLAQDKDHFLIRYHPKTSFEVDASRPAVVSQDAQGRRLVDEWGWLGRSQSTKRLYVRRCRLERPGEEEVILVTDLLNETEVPACDLLEVYLQRWGIERVFQKITEVFNLQSLIGSTPEATIFQGAFCLLLYNILQTVRRLIAISPEVPLSVETLSIEEIFRDVTRQLIALTELLPSAELSGLIPARYTAVSLQSRLRDLLRMPIPKLWYKTKNKRPRRHHPPAKRSGAHTSVAKLIAAAK